ncbi:MAG: DUF4167 domain-containing protein [Rhizobiales bacterium]|nr:DUF4167 domain-containing protein [Hyphomicrobiales bacterium]
MRHSQNRRSRSRSRKGPNPLTRSYESNGPDVKVRGTAAHVAEKYMTLARDAQSSGDIVAAENYLQHAEHYSRIVMVAQAQLQPQQGQYRDGPDDGYEDDRQMNGRGLRDRFESNDDGSRDDDDGDDRFDSSEEEQERGFQPQQQPQPQHHQQRQQQPPRQDDRSRNSRPPERYDRRPDYRNDSRDSRDSRDRSDSRDRNDRPPTQRYNGSDGRSNRNDRNDAPQRFDGPNDRPDRADRGDHNNERGDRSIETERQERFAGPEELGSQIEVAEAVPMTPAASVQVSDEAPPAAPRRRRGRPSRAENGADAASSEPDVTPDGAAALVAFPD